MPTEEQTYRSFLERRLDKQDEALGKILEQTIKTNGRVSTLEDRYQFVRGALWVVGGLLTVLIVPAAFIFVSAFVNRYF